MSEMIERVVRCISPSFGAFDQANGVPREVARRVMEAMRDPTGDMIDAGAATVGLPPAFELNLCNVRSDIADILIGCLDGQPSKTWRAMIDEALRE